MKHIAIGRTYLIIAEDDAEQGRIEALWTAAPTPVPTPTPPTPTPTPPTPTPTPPVTPTPTPPISPLPVGGRAVPTFHCVGLYWDPPAGHPGLAAKRVTVRYVEMGQMFWRKALPLDMDSRSMGYEKFRGSIVNLKPNTEYLVQFGTTAGDWTHQLTFKTWSETPKVKEVRTITAGSSQVNITAGGNAQDGFIIYDGRGATINVNKQADNCVRINASYVILRNCVLRGANLDGVWIAPDMTDVWVEDNDISDFTRKMDNLSSSNGPQSGMARAINERSGIYSHPGNKTARIVIQRNKIHDPSYGANAWDYGHPVGANAIFMGQQLGNHVIRYNDIYVTADNIQRYFQDGIGGTDNDSDWGFTRADTDIYQNKIQNCTDDGIEVEGGGCNVRVWGNYTDKVAVGIASTPVRIGPMYIWKNVTDKHRSRYATSLDSDDRLQFFKARTGELGGGGKRFVFHNTSLQAPPPSGTSNPLGCGGGLSGGSEKVTNTVSRNNIYHIWKSGWESIDSASDSSNDLDYDLYNGGIDVSLAAEKNGVKGTPKYVSGNGQGDSGMYQLVTGSPGQGRGCKIDNFNDDIVAPDMGAHQTGEPPMRFGRAAA